MPSDSNGKLFTSVTKESSLNVKLPASASVKVVLTPTWVHLVKAISKRTANNLLRSLVAFCTGLLFSCFHAVQTPCRMLGAKSMMTVGSESADTVVDSL